MAASTVKHRRDPSSNAEPSSRTARKARRQDGSRPAANGKPAPGGSPSTKRRGTYHHGDLRRALLDQALLTIRNEGVGGLTLRAVGAKLDVSRTALYRHFADKRALLAAVATEGFRLLRHDLIDAWEQGGRGRTGFEEMGMAYVRFAVANPSHYRVMFGGFVEAVAEDTELSREASGAFDALVQALVAQQHAGLVRHDDPRQLARYIWAVVHGVAMLAIDGQLHPQNETIDDITRFVLARVATGIAAGLSTSEQHPPSPL